MGEVGGSGHLFIFRRRGCQVHASITRALEVTKLIQFDVTRAEVNTRIPFTGSAMFTGLEGTTAVSGLVHDVEVARQFTLLLVSLVQKVVDCRDLVVLVSVQRFLCILFFEAILLQHINN